MNATSRTTASRPTSSRNVRPHRSRLLGRVVVAAGVAGAVALGGFTLLGGGEGAPVEAALIAAPAVDPDDIEFAQCMIAHHAQAVEMAAWALDPAAGARPEVVDLARRIHEVQTAEIAMMNGWLDTWGEPAEATSMGHDVSLMSGMQGDEAMAALHASTGAAFDEAWLEMMITHHRGGITMSRHAVEDGADPAVRVAAEAMIAAQTAEIVEMETLLGR